ncbi:SulP family inorganic anion transporter [Rhodococcus sp. BP-332]|uniref:SulP family inorganic anion transporter n=1 Tax=Rhodococcus sp. BP-332 TaxID=2739447 RepID=UPI0035AC0471
MTAQLDRSSPAEPPVPAPSPTPRDRLASVARYDVPASLVVFLVAVPLSIGIAVASGAPVMAGLIAAVIGGILAGALGGSPLQVSGPAAGLTVVVAELVNQFGWRITCLITVFAGVLQVALGLSRIARQALAISPVVVHAMLAGIGITIALQQIHVLLGGESRSSAVANITSLPSSILNAEAAPVAIGGVVVALMLLWPRITGPLGKVPGPLVAVVAGTGLSLAFSMNVERIDLPGNLIEAVELPAFPDGQWAAFATGVLTIALIASVESLLSAVAIDKMHSGRRTNFDRELMGQGAANMVSGVAGGLPVTGVIVRSATNVRSGARSPASAVLHGVWVLIFSVLFIGVVELVPYAALAGLLVMIGVQLVKLADIRSATRTGDVVVYAATVVGVVTLNLLEGVLIGLAISVLLVLRRVLWARVRAEQLTEDSWRVVVEGSLSFLSLPRLTRVLQSVPAGRSVTIELTVDFLDHAVYDALHEWTKQYEATGGTVVVDEVGAVDMASATAGPPRRMPHMLSARTFMPWSQWQTVDSHSGPFTADAVTPAALRPVLAGVEEYHRRSASSMRPHLEKLSEFQDPDTFFLSCVDSRVLPNTITSAGPGDLFTVRNMGNLIPVGDPDTSLEAALEYGVNTLAISSVVVCGHSGCGAMRGLLADAHDADGVVGEWLSHGRASLSAFRSGHPVARDAAELGFSEIDQLAMVNVAVQLQTLSRHAVVGKAVAEGRLKVVGLFFDIPTARVVLVDAASVTELDQEQAQN